MLSVIEYTTDERKISLRCPTCNRLIHDTRIRSDPKDSVWGIMRCEDCPGSSDITYYDKYDRVICISHSDMEE